jgi:Mrp family chromosome partitioning ATPase
MLLVSLGRVDRGLPKEAIARIRSAGAQLLGVVTNAIKEDGDINTAYGYGNRYKYGYGYGYGGYDTRSAYSYYAEPDADPEANTADASPSAQAPAPRSWGGQASQLRRRFLRWVDS